MAAKRRRRSSKGKGGGADIRWSVAKDIGLPEVDRIIHGCKFRNFPTHSLGMPLPQQRRKEPVSHSWTRSNPSKVDRISRMPDEILQFIISLLAMREAAATGILSTRWRNLWSKSLSCLNFDIPNMVGHHYPNSMFEHTSENFKMEKLSNFTSWVNQVMQLSPASRLDALRVSFIFNKYSASDIDTWIMSSVARGVTHIHLDFHHEIFFLLPHNPRDAYEFPAQQVASKLKYLHLKKCKLHLPPDFTGFTSLISLSLTSVHVTQSLMENILSKCPLLEFLSLQRCRYPDGTSLKFFGPSLRLKHLHIDTIDCIQSIELHNINLLSFESGERVSKLSIKDTPHLARLVLYTREPVEISNTPRLETLFLHQLLEKTSVVSQTYVFNNLKRLMFVADGMSSTNLLGVVYVLEACHLLEKLELDMGIIDKSERRYTMPDETLKKLTALPGFPLNNLKEIEIYGFQAYPERIELAKYLLNNAVVLQKMEIYTASKPYIGNGRWRPEENTRKQATTLEEVSKLLQNVARSSTKVELFSSLNL